MINTFATQDPVSAQPTEIPMIKNWLKESIAQNVALIEKLNIRLSSVLRSEPGKMGDPAKGPALGLTTPLALDLQSILLTIDVNNDRLADIIRLLEL